MTAQQRDSMLKWVTPVSLIIGLAFNAGLFVTKMSAIEFRILALEQAVYESRSQPTEIALLKAQMRQHDKALEHHDARLCKLEERK